ncbi:hypothetical protein ACFQ5D_21015 [Paenibacillus farraposensis]|uniref:Uncharacterized protein n=1 Tax=Paenibacillus farraposensis TaxID=2807095 RepID=A0ABW4DL95_9BACL|nr:hypothetical protein [Paenibacillus farraposensis]MCC3382312.1 hypothetical protein [Paenibacillus farraposensis]
MHSVGICAQQAKPARSAAGHAEQRPKARRLAMLPSRHGPGPVLGDTSRQAKVEP